jgi:hypothetical protein
MALVNVKKKIEKSADKIGVRPGEVVIAGCTTNPSGTVNKMLLKELGGVIGGALADKPGMATSVAGGSADRYPSGQHFLVLTNERLFAASLSALTGKPKGVVAEWPRNDVSTIVVEDGKIAMPLTVVFTDGTAVQVEGAKGSDPRSLAEAIAA